jgi:chromosome partitioning protein
VKIDGAYVQGDLRDSIEAMSNRNDYLVIDTAGFSSKEAQGVLVNSHMAIIPFRPKKFDIETHAEIAEMLDRIKYVNPKLVSRVLLNQCPTIVKDRRADDAADFLGGKGFVVFDQRLYMREAYSDAIEEGFGVTEYRSAMAKSCKPEIKGLVKEIINAKK